MQRIKTDKEEERGKDCRKTIEEINAQKEIIFKAINIHYQYMIKFFFSR